MHDPRHVANTLIDLGIDADRPLTHLQVQKLLYFAHARMLAVHGQPLTNELFEVWRYGPVSPSVYHNLSRFRGAPINERSPILLHSEDKRPFSPTESKAIQFAFDAGSKLHGLELTRLTHLHGGPWRQAIDKNRLYISNDSIQRYFSRIFRGE